MNKAALNVLRRIGPDTNVDNQREQIVNREVEEARPKKREQDATDAESNSNFEAVPDELLTESEKRHSNYRRQQAQGGRFPPAAERLPIMTREQREAHNKNRPKWQQTEFEGPIEKLIEKYKDLEEVKRHLTLGQAMKYEFTADGSVLDQKGNVIFDGEKLVKPS
jgi:hypothetical protein